MKQFRLNQQEAYAVLNNLSNRFKRSSEYHLKHLIQEDDRFHRFSLSMDRFFYDFSKQRLDADVKQALIDLAKQTRARQWFSKMVNGERINCTEDRAVLHTATRDMSRNKLDIDGTNILKQLRQVNEKIGAFSHQVHSGAVCSTTGKAFSDAVIVGIGGAYLGCEFVYQAMSYSMDPKIKLHFLPNVDIDNFGQVIKQIQPETCMWVVISKSYTTTETMANLNQVLAFLDSNGLKPDDHLVTITAKGSPGDNPDNPVLASFHMFDFIGGRYSVSSAVGGLPLSLSFGFESFNRFLSGCHQMDQHALNQPEATNIPLTAALIAVWNSNFLNYPTQGIIPYASALSKLAPHFQQLNMESLGKTVTRDGKTIGYPTGSIIFGEPGTNAQHSFFQLAHQGSPFPIDFIGIVRPVFTNKQVKSKGVYNHQELWANMIAQARALAVGKDDPDPAKSFTGNRPSSTILINDVSPESIGMLLSFYEARTVYEGFLLGVNPFDQFGVQLGKVLAAKIRREMEAKNRDANLGFDIPDPATRFYLDTLFKGEL